MANPPLGRGLGDLLKGTQVPTRTPNGSTTESAPPKNPVGRGLGSLLQPRGPSVSNTPHENPPPAQTTVRVQVALAPEPSTPLNSPAQPPAPTPPRKTLPALFLATDLIIILLCAMLAWHQRGHLPLPETVLIALAIPIAAWIGSLSWD